MRSSLFVILFTLILATPEISWAAKVYRVVVFGDSITSGYQLQPQDAFPARLEQRIRAAGYEDASVVSLGRIDLTSAAATAETDAVLQALPDVVVVQLGFNDTKRGVIASAIANNINIILSALKKSGAYIVLVGMPAPDGSAEAYKSEVMGNYYSLSSRYGAALYPSAIEGIAHNPSLTLADGLHPNTAGVEYMVEGIYPLVDLGLRWRYEVYQQEQAQMQAVKPPGLPPVSVPAVNAP